VAARRLGADVPTAYAVQAAAGLVSAPVVALAWWRDAPVPARNVLLVLGTCLTTPYLQDYDLVVGAFVALWLMQLYPASSMPPVAMTAAALILLIPFVGAALGHLTGLDIGPLFIAPAFVIAAQAARVGMRSRRAPLKADVA
jgi:arabinofuranan 3-O-arabinosyltransferase